MNSPATHSEMILLLRVEGVHAAYVKKEILRGVTLTVNRGEIVALLGGNGSGKSTLLKTIAGLLPPTQGRVEFNGRDITHSSVPARQASGIGYLLQGGRVFPNLTVEENFGIAVNHHRRGHKCGGRELGSIFSVLSERAQVRAGLLSGGQRQMLSIEMVLAQEPELALLDEPTGALAPDLAKSILERVAQDALARSASVLLVEQNHKEAKAVAKKCLLLVEGVIQEMSNTTGKVKP